jgi:hypothetical protein
LHHRDGPYGIRDTTTSVADHGRIYGTISEWSPLRDSMSSDTDDIVEAQNLIARYSRICARDHNPAFTGCPCLRCHVQDTGRRLMVPSEFSAGSERFSDREAPVWGWQRIPTCCAPASSAQVWSPSCQITSYDVVAKLL